VVLLLTAAGPFAGGGIAAGQEQASRPPGSGPRLELHAWLCPTGIARADFDFAADCTEPVPGATFTYSPPLGAGFPPEGRDFIETRTTGDDGGATWDALFDDDAFTLEEDGSALSGLDPAIVDYVTLCAVEGDEDDLLALEDFALASVIVPPVEGLGNDRTIVCDWYHIPADPDATGIGLTVNVFACPEDFDAGDLPATCPDPAPGVTLPVSFGPSGGQETYTAGDDGSLSFETRAPSTALFLDTGVSYVNCRDGAGEEIAEDAPPPWVRAEPPYHTFDIVADQTVTCDWYLPPGWERIVATPGADGPDQAG
jgi:hypothetical protein